MSGCAQAGEATSPKRGAPFGSAPAPSAPATVWAVGDGADGSDASRAVAARITAARPDRVLYLGDVYEQGSAEEFRTNFAAVYGRLVDRMSPTPGNHEWPAHSEGYDPFWRRVAGRATPGWYAFRIGGWRIVSLNSETPDDPAQLRWLRRTLDDARDDCLIAFWHRPRYSAGRHGDQRDVAPLWNAVRGRVLVVVSGHDHDLQRFRADGNTVQFVAGAGGRERYAVDARDPRPAFATDRVDGALRIDLRPGLARLSFVAADGARLDRSTARCASR